MGVDSEIKEYKLMPHGFLSYNFPVFGMREEALLGIRQAGDYLRELLEDNETTSSVKSEIIDH